MDMWDFAPVLQEQRQSKEGSTGRIALLKGFTQEQVMELLAPHSLLRLGRVLLLTPGC